MKMIRSQPDVVERELYACNGHYAGIHGDSDDGCGTVYAPGVGADDIRETEIEKPEGVKQYVMKGHCPTCDLDNVVMVEAGVVPVVL